MIYINNERIEWTRTKEGKEFMETYSHLFENGRMVKPFVIKYRPGVEKPDKDNKGKTIKPATVALSTWTFVTKDNMNAEVRYSRVAGRPDKAGNLTFSENSITIVRGQLSTTDPDLAFFFHTYSTQNWSKAENRSNRFAYFQVEDLKQERNEIAIKKKIQSTINARLWNDVVSGGLEDKKIREIASIMMIPKVDSIEDINELKLLMEKMMNLDKKMQDVFLDACQIKDEDRQTFASRKSIIADAISLGLVEKDSIKKCFRRKGDKEPLYEYKGPHQAKLESFYLYMETHKPEILDEIKKSVDAHNRATA